MVAYANAMAGGMMISASMSLVAEAVGLQDNYGLLLIGFVAGITFIRQSKSWLEDYEDVGTLLENKVDSKKVLLIMMVIVHAVLDVDKHVLHLCKIVLTG